MMVAQKCYCILLSCSRYLPITTIYLLCAAESRKTGSITDTLLWTMHTANTALRQDTPDLSGLASDLGAHLVTLGLSPRADA